MSWLEAGPAQEVHTVSGDVARSGVRVDRVSRPRVGHRGPRCWAPYYRTKRWAIPQRATL